MPVGAEAIRTINRDGLLKTQGTHLRRIAVKTFDTLFEALGHICDLFNLQECWNFLKAAGYASD